MNLSVCLLATAETLQSLSRAPAGWGWLDLKVSRVEGLIAVEAYTKGDGFAGSRIGGRALDLPERHRLRNADTTRYAAVWYRGRDDIPLKQIHDDYRRRPHIACSITDFMGFINQGWREPSADGTFLVLVEDRSMDTYNWTAWDLSGGQAVPADLLIYDKNIDPSSVFKDHWPQDDTHAATIAVIGVGSIGSAAALAASDYQIGRIVLIDPDRLRVHNVARHRCRIEDIGRFKVDAVADEIRRNTATIEVVPLRFNIVSDADWVRPVFDNVDVVICCTDGVTSRQATSHLCSTSATSVVFACVLEDGALGEIVRNPERSDVGCLRCLRMHLEEFGVMDPEPGLDLEYGTGTTHRPMTAIAGDLALMGQLAAKAAVTTILERRGYRDQRWTADHLIIGLRPDLEWGPPFDLTRVLDVTANSMPPRNPECPLCCGDRVYA